MEVAIQKKMDELSFKEWYRDKTNTKEAYKKKFNAKEKKEKNNRTKEQIVCTPLIIEFIITTFDCVVT